MSTLCAEEISSLKQPDVQTTGVAGEGEGPTDTVSGIDIPVFRKHYTTAVVPSHKCTAATSAVVSALILVNTASQAATTDITISLQHPLGDGQGYLGGADRIRRRM